MQRHFELELRELQQKLLRLGGLAEDMLRRAVESVLNRDAEVAQAVIEDDDEADALENEIEEYCIQLIALHQPAASDVRFLTMAMKINRDLERMADKSVDIAQRSLETDAPCARQTVYRSTPRCRDCATNGERLPRRICEPRHCLSARGAGSRRPSGRYLRAELARAVNLHD